MNTEPIRSKQLQEALRVFVAEQKRRKDTGQEYVTNEALGKAMGYSNGSLISQYLNDGKPFKGNLPQFEGALSKYLCFSERSEDFHENRTIPLINPKRYVPTSISQDIYNMIDYCRLMKGICILHGEAGTGKTMGAGQYVRDNKGFAHLIRVEEGRIRKREIIVALAKILGVKDAKNAAERYERIREKLHKGQKALIFDEAHRFPIQTLEFLRDLAEDREDEEGVVQDGAGVVLIGNSKVSKFISNVKRDDMEQFRNRSHLDREYLRKQITLDDIRLVFPYLAENGMEKELYALWKVSSRQVWGLRGAVTIYNHAANSGDVSLGSLKKVSRQFKIGIIEEE